ncbi:MAG: hypothetical protein U0441_19455, partial [Polyangiaceae bacterium]
STGTPSAPPPKPSASPSPKAKPAKPPPPPKPTQPPPAEVVSLRSKPQTALGLVWEKKWIADYVIPFDPAAPVKHVSTAANGLEKNTGYVLPVLGDRGVELLTIWDKQRAQLGGGTVSVSPFDYTGHLDAGVLLPGPGGKANAPTIVAFDDGRRVFAILQGDASRAALRTARVPDPTRGKMTIGRRVDAPGVALVWFSATSGDVLAGAVDLGKAEIGAFTSLAGLTALVSGDASACSAKPSGPTYQLLMDVTLPVTVLAHSGKSLMNESMSPVTLLVRADAERLCVLGAEVRGSSRPVDLTATFGPKAAAVARSRSSFEDASKLSLDKLSCALHEPESK